jgi:hypothetical protein
MLRIEYWIASFVVWWESRVGTSGANPDSKAALRRARRRLEER